MSSLADSGTKLNVNIVGDGPPLVFIHGWAASQRFWKHQIQQFRASYRVLAYDLRGHGDSDKPKTGYQVSDHVEDLKTLLKCEKINNPVLIGHSLGGIIALQYTLENIELPRALVLVGTNPRPVSSLKRSIQMSLLSWMIRMSRTRASKYTRTQIFGPDVDPSLIDWVNQDSLRTPTFVVRQTLKAVKAFNVQNRLTEITVPTLIINGEFETTVDTKTVTQMLEDLPQGQFVSIPRSGHNVMLEQPKAFGVALAAFLQQVTDTTIRRFA
ncbi:MAG: alpha/beta fold hydrolase [Candidatus Hodarchaeota archaeon]